MQRKKERSRKREESEEEEEEEKEKEKEKERFRCVSLAHVYVRAHSNRNVVFLLSQVSHDVGKFDRKVRKLGEIEEKTTRKNVLFSVVQSPFGTIISSVC